MQTRIVVLAAGKGTRMNSAIPKVLIPLAGKPLLGHLMEAIRTSGIDPHPAIVVGENEPAIRASLGDRRYQYIRQEVALGTGHAVQCAEPYLSGTADNIIVLYGDHPFVSPETIQDLLALHEKEGCPVTMMTALVEDFNEWRRPFSDFGRVVRDPGGAIKKVVEMKDATPPEREIREINPAFFCFQASWLWPHLKMLTNDNVKGEYYLTDLIGLAISEGACIASMPISPLQSIGINTQEHLEIAKSLLRKDRRSFPSRRIPDD